LPHFYLEEVSQISLGVLEKKKWSAAGLRGMTPHRSPEPLLSYNYHGRKRQ
jgi:hypothetical protein